MKLEVRLDPAEPEIEVVVRAPAMTPELAALLERLKNDGVIFGFQGEAAIPLLPGDILRFYGEDKEVRAQTAAGTYTVRSRLYELEQRLADSRFVRISHSEIVNLRKVTALDLSLTGTIRVTLAGGTVCYVSRRYVKRIKEALGL